MMALHCGLTFDRPLGGIIGFSGFLLSLTLENEANKNVPIRISYGLSDPFVFWNKAEESFLRIDEAAHGLKI